MVGYLPKGQGFLPFTTTFIGLKKALVTSCSFAGNSGNFNGKAQASLLFGSMDVNKKYVDVNRALSIEY